MTEMLTIRWQISEDAVANSVGDETVILHLGNGNYYGLDTIGTILWEGLKGGEPPNDICDRILEEYEVEREIVEADLAKFLAELSDHKLIEKP